MFTPGYYITAELRVKEAHKAEQAARALAELAAETIKESGCTIFTVHRDSGDPARFVLWERFDDEAAFKAHFDEPHTQAYLALDLTEVVRYLATDVVG